MNKWSPQSSRARSTTFTIIFSIALVSPFYFFVKQLLPELPNGLLLIGAGLLFASTGLLLIAFLSLIAREPAKKPSLQALVNFADLWGLGIRKKIKALAGDYDDEISRLYKNKRYKTAQWNRILAWGYAIWYVLRGPLDWVTDYLVSAVKGR